MKSSQPRGDLHRVFPPEIRNYIYEHVLLGQPLIVAGEHLGNGFEEDDYETPKPKFADMAILRSSKTIYQEAKSVLYQKGLFRVYLNFSKWDAEPLNIPTQERADMIANLEIIVNMESWGPHFWTREQLDSDQEEVSDKLETVVEMFSTLQVLRKTCYIRFSLFSGEFAHEVLETKVVGDIFSRLVGFENLIFQVEAPFPHQRAFMKMWDCDEKKAWEVIHDGSSCRIGAKGKVASPDGKEWLVDHKDELAVEVMNQAQQFCTRIREHYDDNFGEPSETDIELHARNYLFFARIKYHPLQSLIKQLRQNADLLLDEANALESGKTLVGSEFRSARAKYAAYQVLPGPTTFWED